MLTPAQIDRLPDRMVALFFDFEDALRTEAAASVVSLEQARAAAVRSALAARAASFRRESEGIIVETMTAAARSSLLRDERIYEAARVAGLVAPFAEISESPNLDRIIRTGIATAKDLNNLTMTSALNAISQEFTDTLDRAVVSVVTGASDPASAIRTAVRDLARNQTSVTFVSEAGRTVSTSLYGAARRSVMTSANQTTLRMQEARLQEVGASYVEVSAHSGARPEHAEWQGQVYRFDELPEKTGYGSGDGLGGWNCRHSWYPYFPEIMEPTFAEFADSWDEEQYELSQEQRYTERQIRKYQTRVNASVAAAKQADAVNPEAAKLLRSDAKRDRERAAQWRKRADQVAQKRGGARRRDREVAEPRFREGS